MVCGNKFCIRIVGRIFFFFKYCRIIVFELFVFFFYIGIIGDYFREN